MLQTVNSAACITVARCVGVSTQLPQDMSMRVEHCQKRRPVVNGFYTRHVTVVVYDMSIPRTGRNLKHSVLFGRVAPEKGSAGERAVARAKLDHTRRTQVG